jgi:hypothetical protein
MISKQEILLSRKAYLSLSGQGLEGANLTLEVFVKGTIDPRTDLVVNLTDVDDFLKKVVADFDHKNLPMDQTLLSQKIWQTCKNYWTHEKVALAGLTLHFGHGGKVKFTS